MKPASAFTWQINLLDTGMAASARPRRRWPVVPLVVAGVVLGGIAAYTQALHRGLGDLRSRTAIAEKRLKDVERRAGPAAQAALATRRQATEALEAEVAQKRVLIEALREVLAAGDLDWKASSLLIGLSERHRDGLWLTKVRVDRLRRDVSLEGFAPDAQAVSGYVAGLGGKDSALANMQVTTVGTEREDTNGAGATAAADPRAPLRFKLAMQTPRAPAQAGAAGPSAAGGQP